MLEGGTGLYRSPLEAATVSYETLVSIRAI